jgi:hypothetical protein
MLIEDGLTDGVPPANLLSDMYPRGIRVERITRETRIAKVSGVFGMTGQGPEPAGATLDPV